MKKPTISYGDGMLIASETEDGKPFFTVDHSAEIQVQVIAGTHSDTVVLTITRYRKKQQTK